MNKLLLFSFFTIAIFTAANSVMQINDKGQQPLQDASKQKVEQVIKDLNGPQLIHSIAELDQEKAKLGKDLIFKGYTTYNGKKSKLISAYFVCTDCHNVTREFNDLTNISPEERLTYAKDNKIPFLQASTFWGIYNRTSFFNGDYEKQYGDLVSSARDTLQSAIQTCSKYCSSGRWLKDWEEEAIMHYFKELELRINDLNLPQVDIDNILNHSNLTQESSNKLLEKVQNSYPNKYEATFLPTMELVDRKYGKKGDIENGKLLYDISCLYCHKNERVADFDLDHSKLTGRMFWKNIKKFNDKSLYQIIRHGTYTEVDKQSYMPLYTKEKMSDEQINDIVAYIKKMAKK